MSGLVDAAAVGQLFGEKKTAAGDAEADALFHAGGPQERVLARVSAQREAEVKPLLLQLPGERNHPAAVPPEASGKPRRVPEEQLIHEWIVRKKRRRPGARQKRDPRRRKAFLQCLRDTGGREHVAEAIEADDEDILRCWRGRDGPLT